MKSSAVHTVGLVLLHNLSTGLYRLLMIMINNQYVISLYRFTDPTSTIKSFDHLGPVTVPGSELIDTVFCAKRGSIGYLRFIFS